MLCLSKGCRQWFHMVPLKFAMRTMQVAGNVCARIYREKARDKMEHPELTPALTPTVRTPQCRRTLWGKQTLLTNCDTILLIIYIYVVLYVISIYVYICLFMVIYDYIWLHMIICDYILLYMIIYDYIWLYYWWYIPDLWLVIPPLLLKNNSIFVCTWSFYPPLVGSAIGTWRWLSFSHFNYIFHKLPLSLFIYIYIYYII